MTKDVFTNDPNFYAAFNVLSRYGRWGKVNGMATNEEFPWLIERCLAGDPKPVVSLITKRQVAQWERNPPNRQLTAPAYRTEGIAQELDIATHWLRTMLLAAAALHEDPVYEATSEQEPLYGPVRSYADMENEITTKLAHLPAYHAMVRIGNDERIVGMPPPLPEHRRLYPAIPDTWYPEDELEDEPEEEPGEALYDAPAPPPRR